MTTVTDAEAIVQAIIETPNTILSQASYDALVNGIKAHRQSAILEGMEIMREAAAQCSNARWSQHPEAVDDVTRNIRALDPAAILDQHTRAKAMDELIAGDADLYDGPTKG
jgi:hypothetical protein